MEKNQRQFSICFFVGAFLVILMLERFILGAITETFTYSEFKALLKSGKITEVAITHE